MNYWRDKVTGKTYFACVLMTNAYDSKEPPMAVRMVDLFTDERFVEAPPPDREGGLDPP